MSRIRIAIGEVKSAIVEDILVQITEHIRSETWMAASGITIRQTDACLNQLRRAKRLKIPRRKDAPCQTSN